MFVNVTINAISTMIAVRTWKLSVHTLAMIQLGQGPNAEDFAQKFMVSQCSNLFGLKMGNSGTQNAKSKLSETLIQTKK